METILIVDDYESNRSMLRQLLSIHGYHILEAKNGQEAIEIFKRESPDLILMDIMMPVMDGHQSATQIKELSGEEYVPIIFITALSSDDSLTRTLDSGGDDFVGKPFNFEVIQSKIAAHLRIRKITQQLVEQNNYLNHEDEIINYFFENTLKQSFLDKRYINYRTSPLSAFNGDVILSQRGPNGGLYLVNGDFTGHGLAASLGTIPVSQVFFKMAANGASINEIAREINLQLKNILPVGMFFAANILLLDPSCSCISIWAGGLMNGFHFDCHGVEKPVIPSRYLPLGVLPDDLFKSDPTLITVEKQDKVYFYSDGITESRNENDETFGEKRLHEVLQNCNENRLEHILQALNTFCGDCDQTDDITIVELTCDVIPAEEKARCQKNRNLIPCQYSIEFTAQMMRDQQPVEIMINFIRTQTALAEHRGMLYTLLKELYNNALDYSLLNLDSSVKSDSDNFSRYYELKENALEQLDSSHLKVSFELIVTDSEAQLLIVMQDNGQGFKTQLSPLSSNQLHGRGMQIIEDLSESVLYSDNGRKVEVVYSLNN